VEKSEFRFKNRLIDGSLSSLKMYSLFSKYLWPSAKQKNVKDHTMKKEAMVKDIDVPTTQTEVTLDIEDTNNRTETVAQNEVVVAVEATHNSRDDSMTQNRRLVDTGIVAQYRRYTNADDRIKMKLGPIIEYAQENLLPLPEACAPLTDLIHNLSGYVQMALNKTPEEPADGLTIDESAAIRIYTFEWPEPHPSLYSMLNHTLRKTDRENLRPYYKYLKLLLTAMVKLPCVPQQTIWRGVTKDLSADFPRGTSVTWWGFSSCTHTMTVLESNMFLGNSGARTLFSIEAINGRAIREHSQINTEDEILLLPGTYMEVQSQLSPATGLHIIHLKQMKPCDILLELPFEGSLKKYQSMNEFSVICRCSSLSTGEEKQALVQEKADNC
jgi:hypothetical protein